MLKSPETPNELKNMIDDASNRIFAIYFTKYKQDLALNSLQWLICHKIKTNQTNKKFRQKKHFLLKFMYLFFHSFKNYIYIYIYICMYVYWFGFFVFNGI